jgi:hypothetical protein
MMATNWNKLQQIERVVANANRLGFDLTVGRDTYQRDGGNLIYLVPLDDKFPHYSRGAEIFCGSIEDIDLWLKGIEWAREYDEMLRLSTDKKRNEREQVERNKQLMQMVKTGKKVDGSYVGPFENDYEDTEVDYDAIPF